ncbi:beta-galactosidase [Vibrio astriarenae]|nr:beta-galactosidase [Vibrio sp. C7]
MNPSPRHTCLFNHDWLFQLNEEHPQPDDWNPITLPHDWSISLPFSEQYDGATGYLPGGVGWYKKRFPIHFLTSLSGVSSILTEYTITQRSCLTAI